ncbi:TetR family transcriptional regulator [Microbacterium deminutum]
MSTDAGEVSPLRRPGRRPGPNQTRQLILDTARIRFAEDGFKGTTIRRIATDAGVDPSLIMQFFGTKDTLFGEVMSISPKALSQFAEAFEGPREAIGERVARAFFAIWEGDPQDSEPLLAMLRGAIGNERATAQLGAFLQARLKHTLGPDQAVRVGIASAMLVGIVVGRRIVQIPALAKQDAETLIAVIAPALQVVLTGDDR